MSETTPLLALPLLAAAQAQKHVTHNEALTLLDAMAQLCVIDRTRVNPPAGSSAGDRHLIAAGATGEWSGHDGQIALYDGGWRFLAPRAGWSAFILAERLTVLHDGTGWMELLAGTPSGGSVAMRAVEEVLELSGTSTVSGLLIPNRAICLGVASRTLDNVIGASAYEVGVAGSTSKFGGSLGVSVGSSNIGVIGPEAFYAETAVVVSAIGGSFTGGTVRLALYYLAFAAPA